jgi:hypothetical protein
MLDPKALYKEFVAKGMHPKDAAKEAQERTGLSVVTGRPINKQLSFKAKGKVSVGQYGHPI